MDSKASSSRIIYFDYMRVIATFLVMLLHVSSACWYGIDVNSKTWFVLNGYKSITDHAVLLFIMISGALFLGRDIPIKKLYLKNVIRLCTAYVFWVFIYSFADNYHYGILSILRGMFYSHYHLWFLPMIIGLYIMVPLLKKIVSTDLSTRYFLLLSFIFSFLIPQICNFVSVFFKLKDSDLFFQLTYRYSELNIHLVIGYSFYFVLGFFIHKTSFNKTTRIIIYCLGIAGMIISVLLSTFESRLIQVPSDTYHANFSISVMLKTLASFVFLKYVIHENEFSISNNRKKIRSLISTLSKYSFGAYLIHAAFIEQLSNIFNINVLSFNPVLSAIVITSGIFIISFFASFLLNKIPVLKKYIV